MSDDFITIPEIALSVKANYQERPSEDEVQEILLFIKDTGTPYLWHGHTHTKPPADAMPVYLGEYDLPLSHKHRGRWSPCPCCSPVTPKYRLKGKIAWFPEEGVIRLIGPKCFASLNQEGHEAAMTAFRIEERRKKQINYLIKHLHIVPDAIKAVREMLPLALALDTAAKELRSKLAIMRLNLWDQMRSGVLQVRVVRQEVFRGRDLSEQTRTVQDFATYASIAGARMLDPNLKRFESRLQSALKRLEGISLHGADDVAESDDAVRSAAASALERGVSQAREVIEEMSEVRDFFSTVTISTLRNWGARSDCPTPLHIDLSGTSLTFGSHQHNVSRVEVPIVVHGPMAALPSLAETRVQ